MQKHPPRRTERQASPSETASPPVQWPGSLALALPLAATLLLAAFCLLPAVRRQPPLLVAFLSTCGVLAAWNALLFATTRRSKRALSFSLLFRKQHYVQACAQLSVYVYWGWHWRQVYDSAYLIAAQLVFAYAFDMLLTWSRRNHYTLGMGPFPIILSVNLFMWFKPDWFSLQFLMVALGFAAKELIRWSRDGRQVHVFNPSSFPLGIAAVLLILTGTTDITWGPEIAATQVLPTYIYFLIFFVSLPAMYLFGVGLTTLTAAGAAYACMLVYSAAMSDTLFGPESAGGGSLPIAVFLGMHLLFTDPSTSPRTDAGRIVFGVLYGLSVAGLYALLKWNGIPEHYDKLLPVPLLNLSVRWIDRMARSSAPVGLARDQTGAPLARNLAYAAAWAMLFAVMQARTDADVSANRAGVRLSLGELDQAIAQYRVAASKAPDRATFQTEFGYLLLQAGNPQEALQPLQRSVALRPDVARAHNGLAVAYVETGRWNEAVLSFKKAIELQPIYPDAQFNLAQLYISGRGVPRDDAEAARLYRSAAEGGNVGAQVNLGVMFHTGQGVPRNDEEAVRWHQRAAERGHAVAQYNLAGMYASGSGVVRNPIAAHMWYTVAVASMGAGEANAETRALALRDRAVVGERMTPGEIAEATRLAKAWHPKRQ